MEPINCTTCGKPKGVLSCEICTDPICKKCAEFLDVNAFSFLPVVPDELKHSVYCEPCYQEKVQPAKTQYDETMAQTENIWVFFTTQRKEIPLIKKEKELFYIDACPDRDEAIARMVFQAAMKGFNALIDVEVTAKKVRNEAYQTSVWSGSGRAAQIDDAKLERQIERNKLYR